MNSPVEHALKVFGMIFAFAVLAGIGWIIWASWERTPSEMLERVDSLAIPAGWTLEEERVVGKKNVCDEKAGCPSVYRAWVSDKMATNAEVVEIFRSVSADTELARECQESEPPEMGSIPICAANAVDSQFYYNLYQSLLSTGEYELRLWMKEKS